MIIKFLYFLLKRTFECCWEANGSPICTNAMQSNIHSGTFIQPKRVDLHVQQPTGCTISSPRCNLQAQHCPISQKRFPPPSHTVHDISAHFLLSKLEHFNNAYLTFTSRFEAKINESQNQNEKKSKKTKTKAADKKKSLVQAKVQSEYDNFDLLLEIYLNWRG